MHTDRVLLACFVGVAASVILGHILIVVARRRASRDPSAHAHPLAASRFGGLAMIGGAAIAFIPTTERTIPGLLVFGSMAACGSVGLLDDVIRARRNRSLGLNRVSKISLLLAIAAVIGWAAHHQHLRHSVFVPVLASWVPLGFGWYVFTFIVLIGMVEAIDLTKNIESLAPGAGVLVVFALTAMTITTYVRSGSEHRIVNRLDVALAGAVVLGSLVGLLWFNTFPAELSVGSSGTYALGGALVAMAIFLQIELLLVVVCGVFVLEAGSIGLQWLSLHLLKRRLFLMVPLHHHFQMKGWSETQITVRSWLLTSMLAVVGFTIFYLDFTKIG